MRAVSSTVYLVSCVSQKRAALAPARDLYVSQWFAKARAYVEESGSPWFILSAEYGLVSPEQVIAPYDKTLNTLPKRDRQAWAARVKEQMHTALPDATYLVVLAGLRYREFLMDYLRQRSIFRKNIGRALLNRDQDPFLPLWELDRTSRAMRNQHGGVDLDRQSAVEGAVSQHIREHFSFVVIPVADKVERLRIESQLISTVSRCGGCRPSAQWLGLASPKTKIRESGLWLVNELYKEPLSLVDLDGLRNRVVTGPT